MKKCVFAGTFDPPTNGHKTVIETCTQLFDETVAAIMVNPDKSPLLTAEERKHLLEKMFAGNASVKVKIYDCAVIDVLKAENTRFYVRGVRNTVDFEYETANYYLSKKLYGDIITLYVPAEQDSLHISSSAIKSFIKFGKNYDCYIPEAISDDLRRILEKKDV